MKSSINETTLKGFVVSSNNLDNTWDRACRMVAGGFYDTEYVEHYGNATYYDGKLNTSVMKIVYVMRKKQMIYYMNLASE